MLVSALFVLPAILPKVAAAQATFVAAYPAGDMAHSWPSYLTAFGDDLYFRTSHQLGRRTYKYNAATNTSTLLEWPVGRGFASYDETLFVASYSNQTQQVWRLDGGPGWSGRPSEIIRTSILDGDLYIQEGGGALWRYNVAMSQPQRVGTVSARDSESVAVYRDELYFASVINPSGLERLVGDEAVPVPGSPGNINHPVTFRDHLYFNTADAIYRYDGSVIEPIFNPSASIGNSEVVVYNNALYFPYGQGMWRIDAEGNVGPSEVPAGSHFAIYDHDLYFEFGGDLWKYHEDNTIRFTLRPDGVVPADADNVLNVRESKTESGLYRVGRYTLGVLNHQPLDSGDLTTCFQLDGLYNADLDKLAGELAELPDVRSAERVNGSRFLPAANLCVTTRGGASGDSDVAIEYDFGDGVMVRAISVPEISPPKVVGVEVDGLSWRVDGYRLPLGSAEQTRPLPFNRVGQIALLFNEPVDFGDEQLVLTDSAGESFELFGPFVDPSSQPGEFKAIWQLEFPLDIGRYELHLGDDLTDSDDLNFDGEWSDNSSVKSGDGQPGGEFRFAFSILPGDVDGDGTVDILDAIEMRNLLGVSSTDPAYSARYDIDARGSVDMADVRIAMVRAFDVLPSEPSASAAAVPEPSGIEYAFVLGAVVLLCGDRKRYWCRSLVG